jgi:hypothetical protein
MPSITTAGGTVASADINEFYGKSTVFNIEQFEGSQDGITDSLINSVVLAVAFTNTGTPKGTFKIPFKKINKDYDVLLVANFNFDSSVTGTAVKFQLDVKHIIDTDTIDLTSPTTYRNEITLTPAVTNFTETLFTIDKDDVFQDNDEGYLICQLSRLNSGLTGTNANKPCNLISLIAYQ